MFDFHKVVFSTNVASRDHITPILRQIHLLPVKWVEFKIATRQLGIPSADKQNTYLADDIYLASESSARCLRSSSGRKCFYSSFWWQIFCCSWTTYLEQITCQAVSRQDKEVSCTEFRRQLKTFMFHTDCDA